MQALAAEKRSTAGQLAIAWVLHQDADFAPIPGTRSLTRLEENIAATEMALSAADIARIEAAFPKGAVQGPRYG